MFGGFNNKAFCIYEKTAFFRRFEQGARGGGRFRFASSTSTLFSYTRSRRRPSSFREMHFRQIRSGNDFSRLRLFPLPRRRMRPPSARKISPCRG